MKLHHRLHLNPASKNTPILLIHGLFGSLDNLGVLGRELLLDHSVIYVDLRNHGLSPHSIEHSYHLMALDLIELLDELALPTVTLAGHSMGGKVAMTLAAIAPQRIDKLVILDIAPVAYPPHQHDAVFTALRTVTETNMRQRHDAAQLMRTLLNDEATLLFLLKSFHDGAWRFNVDALWKNYANIIAWNEHAPCLLPTLFLKGERSDYIQETYRSTILKQFPCARAHVIAGAGHWLHAEKPKQVLQAIQRFLAIQ